MLIILLTLSIENLTWLILQGMTSSLWPRMVFLVSLYSLTKIGPGLSLNNSKEHLVRIILDIEHDNVILKDSFMWDITNPDNEPFFFAYQMAGDLELPESFAPLIAYQIQRQISVYAVKCGKLFRDNLENLIWQDSPSTFVTL